MIIPIDKGSNTPLYKQIVEYVTESVISGASASGDILPSMNELAAELDISKERPMPS